MSEFDEHWLRYNLLKAACNDSEPCHNAGFEIDPDATQFTHEVNETTPYDFALARRSETVVDHDSSIFEFLDFHNAASDLDNVALSYTEPVFGDATLSTTFYSPETQNFTPNFSGSPHNPDASPKEALELQQRVQAYGELINIDPGTCPVTIPDPSLIYHDIVKPLNNNKRPLQAVSEGLYLSEPDSPAPIPAKKRTKRTPAQLEAIQKVRAHGACLRCILQKAKCSDGRPCDACQTHFHKSRKSRIRQWTVCVSSNLSDLNIFALGVSMPKDDGPWTSEKHASNALDIPTATGLYNILFGYEDLAHLVVPLDDLYNKVVRHTYGQPVFEVHPFILTVSTPIHLLVKLNVILLGSPIIAAELIGYIGYLQNIRAILAVVAFDCLGRALNRTNLATSSQNRQLALILQVALLLEQVVETRSDIPAAPIACARGPVFEEMRHHLIQYLLAYLQKLLPLGNNRLVDCIRNAADRGHLGAEFWNVLSSLFSTLSLRKPTMLRKYADLRWHGDTAEQGETLHEYFSLHCSISCK